MSLYKNFIVIMGLLFCSVFAYSNEPNQPAPAVEIEISHKEIARGETFWVHIKTDKKSNLKDYKVHFEDQTINVVPHPKHGRRHYLALVGVPIEHESGEVDFYISDAKQPDSLIKQTITVSKGDYGQEKIRVPKEYTELPHKIKKRIEDEWLLVTAFYNSLEQHDHTVPKLNVPIDDAITSQFGTHRMFNETVQSYHNGIDLRAAHGSEIKAAQAGRVLFTSDLYYAGKHVVIDHGGGVLTTYSHLSDIQVKPGDKVKAGEVIAISGATGRVSGPHLHWVAKVNKVTVNPLQLKELLDDLG